MVDQFGCKATIQLIEEFVNKEMDIQLLHNKGFRWFSKDGNYAKGFIYDNDGKLYDGEKIVNYIKDLSSESFTEFIKNANGSFAIIYQKENEVIVCVDRIRSIPLFYSTGQEIIITDSVDYIVKKEKLNSLDEVCSTFMKLGGFTPGNKTLFPSVHQLIAGQFLYINTKREIIPCTPQYYYEHTHHREEKVSVNALENRFAKVLDNTFRRMIHSLNGKTVVIPLSGGFDSRLIAVMLKKLNYKSVICYTYGRKDSYESRIAKQVANALGYPWHFINYNPSLFEKYFDDKSKTYRKFSGAYSSLPLEQEYFAVSELIMNNLIPEEVVFVPGYSADLPAGSYYPSRRQLELLIQKKIRSDEFILQKHFRSHRKNSSIEIIKNEIVNFFNNLKWDTADDFISQHEAWFTENKVSKFVVNGVRTFEYFGHEWRLPFWDNEFIDFFYSIPNKERIDKKFYNHYLSAFLFKDYDIDLRPQTLDNYLTYGSPLSSLKLLMPDFIKKIAKPLLFRKQDQDVNAFSELFRMVNEKIYDGKFYSEEVNVNYILASWYLKEAESYLK